MYELKNKYYVKTNMHYVEVKTSINGAGEVILTPTKNYLPLDTTDVVAVNYGQVCNKVVKNSIREKREEIKVLNVKSTDKKSE